MFPMLKETFRHDVISAVPVPITKSLKFDIFGTFQKMIYIFLLFFAHRSVPIVKQAKVLSKTVNLEHVKIKF